jgi:hypothetical protein
MEKKTVSFLTYRRFVSCSSTYLCLLIKFTLYFDDTRYVPNVFVE